MMVMERVKWEDGEVHRGRMMVMWKGHGALKGLQTWELQVLEVRARRSRQEDKFVWCRFFFAVPQSRRSSTLSTQL